MIQHVLKDGKRLEDITGHVVRLEDCRGFYTLLDGLMKSERGEDGREENAQRADWLAEGKS